MPRTSRERVTRTSHFSVGAKQRKRNIKKIEEDSSRFIMPFQEYLDTFDLMITKVELGKKIENHKLEIKINEPEAKIQAKEKTDEKLVSVQAKDSCYISDRNWTNLRQIFKIKTSLYGIKKLKKQLEIFELIEVENGFYINPEQKVTFVVSKIIVDLHIKPEDAIVLKLSGDSTNLTKPALKVLNFTFTCLNQGQMAKTSAGNFILGKFIIKSESYEEFQRSLSELLSRLSKIEKVIVNGNEYKIKFKASGDMNFLLISYGLNAANSTYSCFYCTGKKNEFGQLEQNNSINRSIQDANNLNRDTTKCNNIHSNKGYIHSPLIDFIDFPEVVYDTLHVYLRIPEKLLKLFIDDLNVLDGNGSNDISKRPNLKSFIDHLSENCKIQNPFRFGKTIEPRTFKGDDLDRLFSNFNYEFDIKNRRIIFIKNPMRDINKLKNGFNSCSLNSNILALNEQRLKTNYEIPSSTIPYTKNKLNFYDFFVRPGQFTTNQQDTVENEQEKNKFEKIIRLWDMFYHIYQQLKSIKLYSKTNLALFDKLLKDWITLFKEIYFEQEITPYMHLVCFHSTELIKRHKEINNYNLQGLEKYNDITTISYHRSTNRHIKNKEFLRTLINKRIRNEFKLLGFESNLEIKNLELVVKNLLSNKQDSQLTNNTSNHNIYLIKDISSYDADQESWLSDMHIDYVLNSLQNKNQNIKIFLTYETQMSIYINKKFDYNFESEKKIILVWHATDHWITLTNIGFESDTYSIEPTISIFVYDSLNNASYLDSLKPLFKVMYPNKRIIKIKTIKVVRQLGSNDCGLFALAYVKSLCKNEDPALVKYNQVKMRKNYNNFITKNQSDFKIDKISSNQLEREESVYSLEI